MKYHKWSKTRKPVGMLPLFPTPYPGESFYSILCRYHVRSGNVNDWHTIGQLFGYNCSLGSTLLSPYHLDKAKMWMDPQSPISTESLLRRNTAFPLYALVSSELDISRICGMVSGERESTTYPRWVQSRLVHPSGFLRYCPECAAVQKKLYGEQYWQILPQLDGVEYCPVHRIRIKNSSIPLKGIRHKFHPASEELDPPAGTGMDNEAVWSGLFEKERGIFIRLAQGMDWLLQNSDCHTGSRKLYRIYKEILGRKDDRYFPSIKQRELKALFPALRSSEDLYRYFMSKISSTWNDGNFFLYCMSLCSHVMIMNAVSGSPQSFYSR